VARKKINKKAKDCGGLACTFLWARSVWSRILSVERRFVEKHSKILVRLAVIGVIAFFAVWTAYRIERLGADQDLRINNIVRLHAETGVPRNTITVHRTTDFLLEPIHVTNGRALVSASRIRRFEVGQGVRGHNARITSVSRRVDIDTGMFIVRFSANINGTVMVMRQYTGFFLPLEAELPEGVRVIARDARRQVVTGLREGQEIVVR